MTIPPFDDLRHSTELAIIITSSAGLSVVSRFQFPDEKLRPGRWLDVASDIGAHVGYAVQHGCNSISIDLAPPQDEPNRTTPGEAAFEEWAKEQIGDSGYRDPDNYWDRLAKSEQEMWDRIALAARRPMRPAYAPVRAPQRNDND